MAGGSQGPEDPSVASAGSPNSPRGRGGFGRVMQGGGRGGRGGGEEEEGAKHPGVLHAVPSCRCHRTDKARVARGAHRPLAPVRAPRAAEPRTGLGWPLG